MGRSNPPAVKKIARALRGAGFVSWRDDASSRVAAFPRVFKLVVEQFGIQVNPIVGAIPDARVSKQVRDRALAAIEKAGIIATREANSERYLFVAYALNPEFRSTHNEGEVKREQD